MGVGVTRPKGIQAITSLIVSVAFLLAAFEVLVWLEVSLVTLAAWPMPGPAPPSGNPVTGGFFLLTLLNLVAVVAFALRRRGYGYWLLAVVQALDIVALFGMRAMHGPFDDLATNVLQFATNASLAAVILLIVGHFTRGRLLEWR